MPPAKKGLFIKRKPISEAAFFQEDAKSAALRCAEEINECTHEISRLYSAENKLNASLANLLPWAELDLPLEQQGTAHTQLMLAPPPPPRTPDALRGELRQPRLWRS